MRTFKKTLLALLCLSFAAALAVGCDSESESSTPESTSEVVTSESSSAEESEGASDSEEDSSGGEGVVTKYTISFEDSEGNAVVDPIEFTEATKDDVVFPEIPASAQRAGYTAAWDKTVADVTLANLKVTLVYTEIEYTIQFVDTEGNAIVGVEPITFTAGTALLSIGFPKVPESYQREGYTVAWDKTPLDVTLANMEVTLAYTAIEYTVQFVDADENAIVGVEPITYTVETMSSIVFPEVPASYQVEGYTVAWDKTVADVTLGGCTVSLAAPVANTYQITYEANGGSEVAGQEVTFGSAYTVGDPTRAYYEFLGWYVVEDGEMTETKLESGDAWAIASNVTVRAKWSFIEGEYAMKYNFNVTDSEITQITKQAYPGGSTVSFKYYIPEGTQTGWWGIAWNTDKAQANNYHAGGIYPDGTPYSNYQSLGVAVGAWTNVTFTLPAGGDYYLYFGSEMGADKGNWMVGEDNSYVLIDNFTVGETKEDFNKEENIFQVNVAGAVEIGEGYYFERGEYSMKYNFNVTDNPVTQITKQAYPGGSEVSFRYYIPEGTQTGWWGIAWNPNASHANNYHTAGVEANYVGHQALGATTGVWVDVKFTLPADGEYYLYFGAEVNPGNKWVLNGGNSYALIDDFKVGDVTEDFNGGMEESIFQVNVDNAVGLGEGYVAPVFEEGNYAMKYVFNVGGETVSQVTKKAYAAGSKVSFKYYIPEGVNAQWWGICWSKSNTDLDIYAAATNASALPLSNTIGEWTTVEFTLPEGDGEYYLYFGSEVGNWKFGDGSNAYVLIDDFTVESEAENFDKPLEENTMFNVLVPSAVLLGKVD